MRLAASAAVCSPRPPLAVPLGRESELEDPSQVLGRNADAVVLDLPANPVAVDAFAVPTVTTSVLSLPGMFCQAPNRIADEIDEDLHDLVPVGDDRRHLAKATFDRGCRAGRARRR